MRRLLLWSAMLWLGTAAAARASHLLSPGPLAAPHAQLEGLASCTRCHEAGHRVTAERCLACHDRLAARIRAGAGYHARLPGTCVDCHSDHRGTDFALIQWAPATFDHDATGYHLTGAHANLDCARCHTQPQTFLGLDTACAACHADEHRGQLGTDCRTCHDQTGWKPAPGLDHGQARYGLSGRHRQVACNRCHATETDPAAAPGADATFARFRPLAFAACAACHAPAHAGQFAGRDCAECHRVAGFQPARFDHEDSRFALRGRHAALACSACHRPAATAVGDTVVVYRPLPFARCAGCHADPHAGQFVQDCAACHGVAGWKGSPVDHEGTRFPLRGRHRAVDCAACHGPAPDAPPGTPARYRGLAFSACADCHTDPHAGQFAADCANCHQVEGWPIAAFDHDRTGFALRGKHAAVACAACHPRAGGTPARPMRRWRGVAHARCADCHADVHGGQFRADCVDCHRAQGWKPSTFDHDRSRMPLDGYHLQAACRDCHRPEAGPAGKPVIRYRPIDADCRTCHG